MMNQMKSLSFFTMTHPYFKNLQQRKLMCREVMSQSSKHVQHRPDTSVAKILKLQKDFADFNKNVVLLLDAKDVMIVIKIVVIQHSVRNDDIIGINIRRCQKVRSMSTSLRRNVKQKI